MGSRSKPPDLKGQRALVTGAAHGIGRAVARHLNAAGVHVTGLDREPVTEPGVEFVQCDLGEANPLDSIETTLGATSPFDVLVNVAGVFEPSPAVEFDDASYARVLAVNLHAPLSLMRRCVPAMVERGYGRVVNVTSIHAFLSEPTSATYDASKAGLTGASRTFAIEVADKGILVNCVAPGFVRTRMSIVDGVDELESDAFKTQYLDGGRLPIGRAAEAEEIAAAVTWLASPQNTYVAGQTLIVDGGLCATF